MKTTLILLSLVALTFGKIIPGKLEDGTVEVEAAQNFNNYYQNLMNLNPNEREMLGLTMNRDFAGYPNDPMMGQYSPMDQMMMQGQYPSMDFMNYPAMNMGMYPGMMGGNYQNMGMGGNYPNMMMPNFNSYPGYQGVAKTNACGCTSTCGMRCMWWSCTPCVPCPICPEETTTVEQTTTTTTTLATLPTVPQELETTTLPPSNSCPCVRVCPPCLPWFPCNPCSCPCQAPENNTPVTTTSTQAPIRNNPPRNNNNNVITNNNPSNRNNCQCICAPCPLWQDCPPCPKTCPCY
ncbi:hypothetical protein ACKWTF_004210 [Chironomus riparius]